MNLLNNKIYPFLKEKAIFVLPFILWIIPYRVFYQGHVKLIVDSHICFIYTNYFINSILRFVYPMWSPFGVWGKVDFYGARMIGELNPFIHLITFLELVGVSFSLSYFIYLVVYFFFGMAGFYLLAKRIFNDKAFAYLALILFMFSNIGSYLFNDLLVVLILIPTIWFFYFLVAFTQTQEKKFFLGLTFSAMIIAITYLPFYFLTAFLAFIFLFCILFYKDLESIFRGYYEFLRHNKNLFVFCLISVFLSLIPGLLWYEAGGGGDYVAGWRNAGVSDEHSLGLSLKMINVSGLVGPNTLHTLISNLSELDLNHFYIPIFAYLIVLVGFIVPINRRLILFLGTSLFLFLISLANVTPIHEFLYNYAFYFKYFRNLHFLLWFALPFFILFLVEQLQGFVKTVPKTAAKKKAMLIFTVLMHICAGVFLSFQENAAFSSFITITLSLIFFSFLLTDVFKARPKTLMLFFLVMVVIQPMEVLGNIANKWRGYTFEYGKDPYTPKESIPRFSYLRPKKDEPTDAKDTKSYADVVDQSGFVNWGPFDIGLKWSYFLQQNVNHAVLKDYVQYKFFLYDHIEWMDPKNVDVKRFEEALRQEQNIAFVSSGRPDEMASPKRSGSSQREVITEDSERFKVVDFDLNHIKIKTDLPKKKFLVYNDSYHKDWQAKINGKPIEIIRANVAFKGLWLPVGTNTIDLTFRPGQHHIHRFLVVFFIAFLGLLIYCFVRKDTASV